jgi:hypothetical protein
MRPTSISAVSQSRQRSWLAAQSRSGPAGNGSSPSCPGPGNGVLCHETPPSVRITDEAYEKPLF